MSMFIKNWDHAVRLFNNGRLTGDDLVLYADQLAPAHCDEARWLAEGLILADEDDVPLSPEQVRLMEQAVGDHTF